MSPFGFEKNFSEGRERGSINHKLSCSRKKNLIKFNDIFKLIQKLPWIDQALCHPKIQALSQYKTEVKELTGKRKSYWQEGDQPALSTRMNPSISWLSLWLFHHILSPVLKNQHSTPFNLLSYEGKQHGSVLIKIQSLLSSLVFQHSLDINGSVYYRLQFQKEGQNWKRRKLYQK